MAIFCGLCGKKIGILSGYYSVAETKLCDKCYSAYDSCEKQMYSNIGDFEKIIKLTDILKETYKSNETVEVLINHINELHELRLREIEKENAVDKIENNDIETIDNNYIHIPEFVGRTINENIGPFENQDLVYTIDGVRGRHIDIYSDKVVITTKVTIGSLLTHNATDGEKTIYYSDCIGVQFKQSKFAIGYLQLETASSNGNNKHSNFFAENSFTFDTTVISNEQMIEVADYVKSRVDAVKKGGVTSVSTNNSSISVADELLKLKQLLDMGVLSQEEFDEQKNKLLNQ